MKKDSQHDQEARFTRPILRLGTYDDVPALMAMRRAREEWMAERDIHQWPISNRPAIVYLDQIDEGRWYVIDARPGDPTYDVGGLRGAVRLSTEIDPDDLGDPGAPGLFAHGLMADLREAGNGVGPLILDGMVEYCRAHNLQVIRIDCVARVKPFYENYGFRPTGTELHFPPDEVHPTGISTYVLDYWIPDEDPQTHTHTTS